MTDAIPSSHLPTDIDNQDNHWMRLAIEQAKQGQFTVHPNPLVGCVLVKHNQLLSQGAHLQAGGLHAEPACLQQVSQEQTHGATLYVTLEPCCHHGRTPPCIEVIIAAGIQRVVVGQLDSHPQVAGGGIAALRQANIDVTVGVLQAEVEALNPGFNQLTKTGRPFVRLKVASSVDGKTAMASGESQWITGPLSRQDVQYQRARASVIVSGVRSVLTDQARLTVRPDGWLAQAHIESLSVPAYPKLDAPFEDGQQGVRQPIRCILDARLQMPVSHPMLAQPGHTWLLYAHGRVDEAHLEVLSAMPRVRCVALPIDARGRFDLAEVVHWLGSQSAHTVWIEAGAALVGSVVKARCWDEFYWYVAPKLMGHQARPLMELDVLDLANAPSMHFMHTQKLGEDICCVFAPESAE